MNNCVCKVNTGDLHKDALKHERGWTITLVLKHSLVSKRSWMPLPLCCDCLEWMLVTKSILGVMDLNVKLFERFFWKFSFHQSETYKIWA